MRRRTGKERTDHGKKIYEWKKADLSSDHHSDRGIIFCFNTLPLIKGVIYSFTNFKGYGSYDWVGLRNYKDLFTDSRVGGSYLFTFKLAIVELS